MIKKIGFRAIIYRLVLSSNIFVVGLLLLILIQYMLPASRDSITTYLQQRGLLTEKIWLDFEVFNIAVIQLDETAIGLYTMKFLVVDIFTLIVFYVFCMKIIFLLNPINSPKIPFFSNLLCIVFIYKLIQKILCALALNIPHTDGYLILLLAFVSINFEILLYVWIAFGVLSFYLKRDSLPL